MFLPIVFLPVIFHMRRSSFLPPENGCLGGGWKGGPISVTSLLHGLLRASFVPPKPIRELRTLTRYRRKLLDSRSAERCPAAQSAGRGQH